MPAASGERCVAKVVEGALEEFLRSRSAQRLVSFIHLPQQFDIGARRVRRKPAADRPSGAQHSAVLLLEPAGDLGPAVASHLLQGAGQQSLGRSTPFFIVVLTQRRVHPLLHLV